MKKFKEVEITRKDYHRDPTLNSIHRSSLMVPEIEGTEVDISFLNHFLLKRNHSNVACKITAIDLEGNKIESKLHKIDNPIVYTFTLTGMVKQPVSNYMIEFFAPDNLFIPFPAVMINHRGKNFINQVHAFNRVLNDIFEDDVINSNQVKEASVDLPLNSNSDTFLLFTAGPFSCDNSCEIEIRTIDRSYKKTIPINVPRFGRKKISIRENFNEMPEGIGGIIKVTQPKQSLFYGRMFCGQSISDGSFSANHSYYDSSSIEEYWDDLRPSSRFYPFFSQLSNIVRLYPIMSKSNLAIQVGIYSDHGSLIKNFDVGNIHSPSDAYLDININELSKTKQIDLKTISTFSIIANVNHGKMPTRIGHQLIYGAGGLNSSIAVSLFNPNIFSPPNKKSFKWGQAISGGRYDSLIGIVADPSENSNIDEHNANIKFYTKDGLISEKNMNVKNGSAIKIKVAQELGIKTGNEDLPEYIWCTIDSEHLGLNFFSIAFNLDTKHTSGEHGF